MFKHIFRYKSRTYSINVDIDFNVQTSVPVKFRNGARIFTITTLV